MKKKLRFSLLTSMFLVAILFMFSFSTLAVEEVADPPENDTDQSEKHIDPELEGKTKELAVQDKTLKAVYVESETKSGYCRHDTAFYETENGDRLGYSAKTGQLVYLTLKEVLADPKLDPALRITNEQAKTIAKTFFDSVCDMSKYSFTDCTYYESRGDFHVEYGLYFQGYRTTENITISITNSGEISNFSYRPYIFDGVKERPITEEALLRDLTYRILESPSQIVEYGITDYRLNANENNELIMEYFVVISFVQHYEDGESSIIHHSPLIEIKVPDFAFTYDSSCGEVIYVIFEYHDRTVMNVLGDINGDEKIRATDARTALRASAKLETLSEEQQLIADVNIDGKVTAVDARIILRTSAGLQKIDEVPPFDPYYVPQPMNPEVLSAEQEDAIKADWVKLWDDSFTEEPMVDLSYYGTYNGCVALLIQDNYYSYPAVISHEVIDGISFRYGGTAPVKIWKEGSFYDIKDAYENELITKDDLRSIAYYHN